MTNTASRARADHYPGMRHGSTRMKRKLQTRAGRAILCGSQNDCGAGLQPDQTAGGSRHFLLRGLAKVRGEWALVCLTHNILKLYRLCYA